MIVTSTAGAFGALSTLVSGLRTAGNNTPILNSWAGDGDYWLPKSPQVTNYCFVTFASIFGDDPIAGRQQAREAGEGGNRRLRHRLGRDRRRRHRDQAGRRLDERRRARGADGEVQEGADAVRPRELLAEAAHRVRPAVPRDQDPGQHGDSSSAPSSPRSSRRSTAVDRSDRPGAGEEARRNTPGLLRFPLVRGRPGAPRRDARAAPRRGRRPDRAERRRQVDARQRPQRLRPAERRARSSWRDAT